MLFPGHFATAQRIKYLWIRNNSRAQQKVHACVAKTLQSCPTLCNPTDYIAHQAPLSMGFSGQEYWSRLSCSSPGDLPDPRDWTHIFYVSCIGRGVLNYCAVLCLATQSCLTLCDPMNCSSSGSSVHDILQARILELMVVPFSRGSSQPRDQILISHITGRFFTFWATREDYLGKKLRVNKYLNISGDNLAKF